MNFKNILSLLLVVIIFCSCSKDEGNYDYKSLGDLEVKNINSSESYGFVFGETVEINPEIVTDIDESEFAYVWFIDRLIRKDTIGTEKNLSRLADFEGGKLIFEIEHTPSGIKWRHDTQLNIQYVYEKGWAILSNTTEDAKLNFLSSVKTDPNGGGILYEYYPEAYKIADGGVLAKGIVNAQRDGLWMIQLEDDAIRVKMSTLQEDGLLSDHFTTTEYLNGPFKPEYIGFTLEDGNNSHRLVSSGGDLFIAYGVSGGGDVIAFTAPILGEHYIGKHVVPFNNNGDHVVYDEASERYLWVNTSGGKIESKLPMHASGSDTSIDIGNVNMECKKMGILYKIENPPFLPTTFLYSILKDESGDFHLHVFNASFVTLKFTRNIQVQADIINDNSIIASAKGNLYIATGNKLHLYNGANNTFTYDWKVYGDNILALSISGAEMAIAIQNGDNSEFSLRDLNASNPADEIIQEFDVEGHVVAFSKIEL